MLHAADYSNMNLNQTTAKVASAKNYDQAIAAAIEYIFTEIFI